MNNKKDDTIDKIRKEYKKESRSQYFKLARTGIFWILLIASFYLGIITLDNVYLNEDGATLSSLLYILAVIVIMVAFVHKRDRINHLRKYLIILKNKNFSELDDETKSSINSEIDLINS